jgi:serine/threonine protein kinase
MSKPDHNRQADILLDQLNSKIPRFRELVARADPLTHQAAETLLSLTNELLKRHGTALAEDTLDGIEHLQEELLRVLDPVEQLFRRPDNEESDESSETETPSHSKPFVMAPGVRVPGTNYVLVKPLGDGGFGVVWKAKHSSTGEIRALKFCIDHNKISSFRMEAKTLYRILKQIPVQGVVQIHEFFDIEDDREFPFIIYEYVQGEGDLKTFLETRSEKQTPMTIHAAAEMIRGITKIVADLHSLPEPIVHRDLKPANIMVVADDPDFIFKIIDFGLSARARMTGEDTTHRSESVGFDNWGTEGYMSPEQTYINGSRSPSNDVYSLGIIWYELLFNNRDAIPSGPPKSMRHLDSKWAAISGSLEQKGFSPEQAELLTSCLKIEEDRPKDAKELYNRLYELFPPIKDDIQNDVYEINKLRVIGDDWLGYIRESANQRMKIWKAGVSSQIPEAEWIMGLWWESYVGTNIKVDEAKRWSNAASWHRKSAKAGFANAQYDYSLYCEYGIGGVDADPELAQEYLEQAAEQSYREALFDLGMLHLRELQKDDESTWEQYRRCGVILRRAADAGHCEAMFQLAMQMSGQDRKARQDKNSLFLKAAQAGHTEAQYQLALSGVDAVKWYQCAAESRHVDAQFRLGKSLLERSETEDDYDSWLSQRDAEMWLWRAADNGHPSAIEHIQKSNMTMNASDSVMWQRATAVSGHVESTIELVRHLFCAGSDENENVCYMVGRPEAIHYLLWAASLGSAEAEFASGMFFEFALHPLGVGHDECERWYVRAARQGHSAARTAILRRRRGTRISEPTERETDCIKQIAEPPDKNFPGTINPFIDFEGTKNSKQIRDLLWPRRRRSSSYKGSAETKIRVYELAKLVDIENQTLIDCCSDVGITKNSAQASLTPKERDAVVSHIKKQL